MPPIRYYNQSGPFWDFIASLEEQAASHPFFNSNNEDNNHARNGPNENNEQEHDGPAAGPNGPPPPAWGPWGPFPHRGRHGGPHHPPPPPPPAGKDTTMGEKAGEGEGEDEDQPSEDPDAPRHGGPHGHGHGRRHGYHHGPHARGGPGGRCGRGFGRGGGGGRCGGRRGFSPYGVSGVGPFGPFAEALQGQFFGWPSGNRDGQQEGEDFTPEVDVFDTPEAFVMHVSLAGAKKEDLGVSWDAERSEVTVAGVVHRPGDEEFLKNLVMRERKTGVFERKVRLGSRANPAQVDSEGIVARMEDGVLRIEVPKLEAAGFVEIRKVDVE